MKIISCKQGSPEWHAARLGIPTASAFGKIVTASGKLSAQADGYLHALVAERILGLSVDAEATDWMERGKITEAEAVALFELRHNCDTKAVGFVTTDDGRAGCSPDRLVGSDSGLEIKCPSAAVHVGYLLDVAPRRYWPQIQGALWITGFQRWHFLSYCPEFPPAEMVYERDEKFIALLADEVHDFNARLDAAHAKVADMMSRNAA